MPDHENPETNEQKIQRPHERGQLDARGREIEEQERPGQQLEAQIHQLRDRDRRERRGAQLEDAEEVQQRHAGVDAVVEDQVRMVCDARVRVVQQWRASQAQQSDQTHVGHTGPDAAVE